MFGETPLSIMIVRDVCEWAQGYFHFLICSVGKRWSSKGCLRANVKMSALTVLFRDYGANVGQVDVKGNSVWHGLAKKVFKDECRVQGCFLGLVLRQFQLNGLDVCLRNCDGESGMDLFMKRITEGKMVISSDDYNVIRREVKYLEGSEK